MSGWAGGKWAEQFSNNVHPLTGRLVYNPPRSPRPEQVWAPSICAPSSLARSHLKVNKYDCKHLVSCVWRYGGMACTAWPAQPLMARPGRRNIELHKTGCRLLSGFNDLSQAWLVLMTRSLTRSGVSAVLKRPAEKLLTPSTASPPASSKQPRCPIGSENWSSKTSGLEAKHWSCPGPCRNKPGTNPEPIRNKPGTNPAKPGWFPVGLGLVPGRFRQLSGGLPLQGRQPISRELSSSAQPTPIRSYAVEISPLGLS